jgi:hypothetical protein
MRSKHICLHLDNVFILLITLFLHTSESTPYFRTNYELFQKGQRVHLLAYCIETDSNTCQATAVDKRRFFRN